MEDRRVQGSSESLGALVRARRESVGLTQRQLAARAGVSMGAVRDIEQGRTAVPRPGSLARLTAALELSGRELDGLVSMSGSRPTTAVRGHRPGPEGASHLELAVLGPLAARHQGVTLSLGPVRQRALLGLLALHHGTGLSRAAIVDALWGEDPPPAAVGMLQGYVARLRRLVGPGSGPWENAPQARGGGLLSWDGASYRLAADGIRFDLADFGELSSYAQQAASAGDAKRACGLYAQALRLWRGEPLADLEVLRGHPAVTELGRRRVAVVIEYADTAGTAGMYGQALGQLRALAEREPLDERVHARLMAALAATGQQAAALGVYEDLRLRLDRELGVRPGRELAEVHLRVLRQEIPAAAVAALGPTAARPAGVPEPVVPRQLPALGVHFTGRAAELTMLDGLLDKVAAEPGAGVISVISGTAGVGKTALAVHWAHHVASRFPDGQLYVNLRGFESSGRPVPPAEAIRGLLDALEVPAERIPVSLDAQTGLYRSLLAGRRVLVVLDNARNAEQVRPLLPGSHSCLVVVTSRSQLAGLVAAEGAHQLALDLLTEAEARELMALRLGAERLGAEPGAAAELIGLCARLPLALAIAAAHASVRPGLWLGMLAEELKDAQRRLDALETGDPAVSVRAVFSWSVGSLLTPADRMFRLLGLHPGPDITTSAAASLASISPPQARRALRELAEAHLISEHASGRFSLHDLLRAYATEQAADQERETERHAAVQRTLDYYLHTTHAAALLLEPHRDPIHLPPPQPGAKPEAIADDRQAMAWFGAEHRVLTALINLAVSRGLDSYAWQLPAVMATFYERRGTWSDHAAAQDTALAAAQRAGDKTGQATAHNYLGHISVVRGSYDGAGWHFQQARALFRQIGSRTGEARAHLVMGMALDRQGRYGEALEHAEQARDLYGAEGHRGGQAVALHNIGWAQGQMGRHQQALASLQQALDLFSALGHRPGEAAAWSSLGDAHSHCGHHTEAGDYYTLAVELFAELGDLWSQATALADLGHVRSAVGETQAALAAWREAVEILDSLHHPDAEKLRAEIKNMQPPA